MLSLPLPNTAKPGLTDASRRSVWARVAVWLGFLAVFAALVAPVSMLAEEVRTGKLGGLCSVASSLSRGTAVDLSGDAASAASHCDLCAFQGLGFPPQEQAHAGLAAFAPMIVIFSDAVRSASSPGLPFSRGPPTL